METRIIREWLFQHSGKVLTPHQWCELLGTDIIDADGWRDADYNTPLGLVEFINRLSECTIYPL